MFYIMFKTIYMKFYPFTCFWTTIDIHMSQSISNNSYTWPHASCRWRKYLERCREDFRLRVETGRKGRIDSVRRAHILVGNVHRKVRGIFIPHYKALSSLSYKMREGFIVKGLPILSHKGIPFWSTIISPRVSSRVCNFLYSLLLLLLLEKFGRRSHGGKLC